MWQRGTDARNGQLYLTDIGGGGINWGGGVMYGTIWENWN